MGAWQRFSVREWRRSVALGSGRHDSRLARWAQPVPAPPLLVLQDLPENDLEGRQPGNGHPAHPPGDSAGVECDNFMEVAPVELRKLEVQLPPPGQGPRTNGSKFAQAPADVAPAAYVASPPAAAPQHLGG